jgi:hypothetical protein
MRRPLSRLPTVLAALALLAACGGPLFYVEVTIPSVKVSLPQQSFPAFTGIPDPGTACDGVPNCLFKDLEYDLADAVPLAGEDNVEVDLRLTAISMTLQVTPGGPGDLGDIEEMAVKIVNPDDPTDFEIAASYVRTEPNPTTITVSGNANLDLGRYLTGTVFHARAEMIYATGAIVPAFTADVDTDFSVVLKLDYGSYVY